MNGVATTDKFRIVVKYGVEYVPTGQFEPFVENKITEADDEVKKTLKDVVKKAGILSSVNGTLG